MLNATKSTVKNGPRADLIYLYWWSHFTPTEVLEDLRRNGIKSSLAEIKRRFAWFRRQGRTQCDKYELLDVAIEVLRHQTNGLALSTLDTPLAEQPITTYISPKIANPNHSYNPENPDGFK